MVSDELDRFQKYMENSNKVLAQRRHFDESEAFALNGGEFVYQRIRKEAPIPESGYYEFRPCLKVNLFIKSERGYKT